MSSLRYDIGNLTQYLSEAPAYARDKTWKFRAKTAGSYTLSYQKDGAPKRPAPSKVTGTWRVHLVNRAPPPPSSSSSSTPSCRGTAQDCDLRSSACEDGDGCRWRSVCTGSADACSIIGVSSCLEQDGCVPDYLSSIGGSDSCTGSPTSCDSLDGASCSGQSGCNTEDKCTGLATPCDSIEDAYTCSHQPGCSWR